MVQRFAICFLGVTWLAACGGGQASDAPAPVNQDPAVNSQDPATNQQDPSTPSQRPPPPAVVIDTSAGGSSNSAGSSGNSGGTGNVPGSGDKCKADDFCAGCDTSDCPTYCACLNDVANGALDCKAQCQ